MDRPNYPHFIGFGPSLGAGGATIKHVEFLQDPFPALTAPVTEILDMTLKAGKTKENLYDVLNLLASKLDVEAPYPPLARGEVREEPGKGYLLVLGWNSSKVSLALLSYFYLVLIFIHSLGALGARWTALLQRSHPTAV